MYNPVVIVAGCTQFVRQYGNFIVRLLATAAMGYQQ
jgi:hypothetical protein